MGTEFFIAIDVFPVDLLACKFQCSTLQIDQDSSIYILHIILSCLYGCMTSSVISFAYFTHFSNLNISGTDADICKRETSF